jgi:hypothetical protein
MVSRRSAAIPSAVITRRISAFSLVSGQPAQGRSLPTLTTEPGRLGVALHSRRRNHPCHKVTPTSKICAFEQMTTSWCERQGISALPPPSCPNGQRRRHLPVALQIASIVNFSVSRVVLWWSAPAPRTIIAWPRSTFCLSGSESAQHRPLPLRTIYLERARIALFSGRRYAARHRFTPVVYSSCQNP